MDYILARLPKLSTTDLWTLHTAVFDEIKRRRNAAARAAARAAAEAEGEPVAILQMTRPARPRARAAVPRPRAA